jgi:hypothetical protein
MGLPSVEKVAAVPSMHETVAEAKKLAVRAGEE